jgi:starch phosphorylase
LLASGAFSPDEPDRYEPLLFALRHYDTFMVTADFDAYFAKQREVEARWREPQAWWRSSILNTARMAWFSSDRTIRAYAEEIWDVPVGARAMRRQSAPS